MESRGSTANVPQSKFSSSSRDVDTPPQNDSTNRDEQATPEPWRAGSRFWLIFPGLCLASMLCSLESTILATALPTIVRDLHSSWLSVWAINAYTLAFSSVQPLFGQTADIFGRKSSIITALTLFLLGSGLCGGAINTTMLIAGRVVQGLGGGGLSILPAMVVCDVVSLRERQKYNSIIYAVFAIGTFLGPVLGGIMVDHIGWRWCFWINLPICGAALLLVGLFLRVRHGRSGSTWTRITRIDYIGNGWLVGSLTSILISLSSARTISDWSTLNVLVPLCVGIVGVFIFFGLQASPWLCPEPTIPLRLFSNWTSSLGFLMNFLNGLLMYWATYYLPVYFQAVIQDTAQQSGINTLAILIPIVPFGIAGGICISKTGHYKPNLLIGFALAAIAIGCFSLFDHDTATGVWVILQGVFAAGAGLIVTSTLPTIQAPLQESDVATATAVWGFTQGIGFICGMAVPSSIFEARFSTRLHTIADPIVRKRLATGSAYEHASRAYLQTIPLQTRTQVVDAYADSLVIVWYAGVGFAILGFAVAAVMKEVSLRETLETNYGLREGSTDDENAAEFDDAEAEKNEREEKSGSNESRQTERNEEPKAKE
jgi:MFS family permease